MVRKHYDVNIMRRPHAFQCDICICLKSYTAKELGNFLLIVGPLSHGDSLAQKAWPVCSLFFRGQGRPRPGPASLKLASFFAHRVFVLLQPARGARHGVKTKIRSGHTARLVPAAWQ